MKFDQSSFTDTAQAVYIMNSSIRDRFANWHELEDYMRSMAYAYRAVPGFYSTGGFCLTSYETQAGAIEVVASVMAYMAFNHVTESS